MFILLLRVMVVVCMLGYAMADVTAAARDWSLSLYAGRMTTKGWQDSLSSDVEFADVGIAVVAGAWTFKRFFNDALSLEMEAQVGKHFGDQDHFEFNMTFLTLRWAHFPWQRYVATTFAWGIGPSYATEVPEVEAELKGDSHKFMVYWMGELTFGPPRSDWAVMLRLHHRSGAFGVVADEGGSNTLTAGLKFYF